MVHTETPPPLETATPIEIVGAYRNHDEIGRAAMYHMTNELFAHRQFPGEIPLTTERVKQLDAMDKAMEALAYDAGVDLERNLPPTRAHHFFKTDEDTRNALRTLHIDPAPELEGQSNEHGIFITEQASLSETLSLASHERFHFVDQTTFAVKREDGAVTAWGTRSGYATDGAFRGLNEMITDLRNVHLVKGGYWAAQPDLPKQTEDIYHYTALDVLGDELIQRSAEIQGISPIELLRALERDAFLAQSSGLRQLLAPFDTDAKRRLVHLPHTEPEVVRELALDLGLPEALAKIDAFRHGNGSFDVLDWAVPAVVSIRR